MTRSEPPGVRVGADRPGGSLVVTPFHAAGFVLLVVGFVLAVYQGLQAFDAVDRLRGPGWLVGVA